MARALVEDCWFVEVLEFDQCAYLERDGEGYATCRQEGCRSFEIVWQLVGNNLILTHYTVGLDRIRTDYKDLVSIVRTPSEVGGERVWFMCPWCYRKVRKLYLSPQGEHFRCRICHNLSYRSQTRLAPWPEGERLRKKLDTLRIGSRRYMKTFLQMQKYDEALRRMCLGALPMSWDLPPELPTRHPGRPLQERAARRGQGRARSPQSDRRKATPRPTQNQAHLHPTQSPCP